MPKFSLAPGIERQVKDAIRDARYKLVLTTLLDTKLEELELFDIQQDPGEQHNVARDQVERAAAMADQLRSWRKTTAEQARGIQSVISPSELLKKIGYIEGGKPKPLEDGDRK
jgi:hypothetical protein